MTKKRKRKRKEKEKEKSQSQSQSQKTMTKEKKKKIEAVNMTKNKEPKVVHLNVCSIKLNRDLNHSPNHNNIHLPSFTKIFTQNPQSPLNLCNIKY